MKDNGKKYKVLKPGLSQNIDGERKEPAVGTFISLTDEAAAALLADGYVEEVKQKKGATK